MMTRMRTTIDPRAPLCGSSAAPEEALESWQLQQTAVHCISMMYLQRSVQQKHLRFRRTRLTEPG